MPETPTVKLPSPHSMPLRRAGVHAPSLMLFIMLAMAVLAFDLAFKAWSFEHVAGVPVHLEPGVSHYESIPDHEAVVVIPRVLNLKLTANTGAVFGIGKGARPFFVVMSIAAVGVIGWIFVRSSAGAHALHIALALILAGALGNMYDRVQFAAVRDMLNLFPGVTLPFGWSWPGGNDEVYPWIFNIADIGLVVGVILLMLILWLGDRRAQTAQAKPN